MQNNLNNYSQRKRPLPRNASLSPRLSVRPAIMQSPIQLTARGEGGALKLPENIHSTIEMRKAIFTFLDKGGSVSDVFKEITMEKAYNINSIVLYHIKPDGVLGAMHPKIKNYFDTKLDNMRSAIASLTIKDDVRSTPSTLLEGQADGSASTVLEAGWTAYCPPFEDHDVIAKMLAMAGTALREYYFEEANQACGVNLSFFKNSGQEDGDFREVPGEFIYRRNNEKEKFEYSHYTQNNQVLSFQYTGALKGNFPWQCINDIIRAGIGEKFSIFTPDRQPVTYRRDNAMQKIRAGDLHKDFPTSAILIRFDKSGLEPYTPLDYYDVPRDNLRDNIAIKPGTTSLEDIQKQNIKPLMSVGLPMGSIVFSIHDKETPHAVRQQNSAASRNLLVANSRDIKFKLPISRCK